MKTKLADELFRMAQANAKAIDGCPGPHDFKREDTRTMRCTKCGGITSPISVYWYEQGLKHAAQH